MNNERLLINNNLKLSVPCLTLAGLLAGLPSAKSQGIFDFQPSGGNSSPATGHLILNQPVDQAQSAAAGSTFDPDGPAGPLPTFDVSGYQWKGSFTFPGGPTVPDHVLLGGGTSTSGNASLTLDAPGDFHQDYFGIFSGPPPNFAAGGIGDWAREQVILKFVPSGGNSSPATGHLILNQPVDQAQSAAAGSTFDPDGPAGPLPTFDVSGYQWKGSFTFPGGPTVPDHVLLGGGTSTSGNASLTLDAPGDFHQDYFGIFSGPPPNFAAGGIGDWARDIPGTPATPAVPDASSTLAMLSLSAAAMLGAARVRKAGMAF